MTFNEMVEAVEDAKRTQARADTQMKSIAKLLVGNLRRVTRGDMHWDHDTLCEIKRELGQYNASTKKWKS